LNQGLRRHACTAWSWQDMQHSMRSWVTSCAFRANASSEMEAIQTPV
jgi:hypothetical protein